MGLVSQTSLRTVAVLGNHLPRQCGIATFTADLTSAIEAARPDLDCFVVAMNDLGRRHAYPPKVRFEIPDGDVDAYRRAADFLNVTSVDVVSLQHEYGIFGGPAGSHVLELLRGLRMPVVTTLHTILANPDVAQRAVMNAVIELSERLVVMSADGAALLSSVHRVDAGKIDVIPHGIPFIPEGQRKDVVGVEDRQVILTFGLLSPDKGLEYVIDALPAIVEKHPRAVYIVLGATHPHVKLNHGEAYRLQLQARAEKLGVGANVIFHNRFVSHDELVEFSSAADLYVTPYLNEAQSTSGTLAYAVGSGKAVISTPYRYARELLAEGRGVLVPLRDGAEIAREVISLFDEPVKREAMQQRAALFGQSMSWPKVANRTLEVLAQAQQTHAERRRAGLVARSTTRRRPELPQLNLAHVQLMTDDTGILQHATFDVPRYRDGYCLDDNARALILMTAVEEAGTEPPHVVRQLTTRYLAFLSYALDETSGRFQNFLNFERRWQDGTGSDDAHGRALWALGTVVGRSSDAGRRALAVRLFLKSIHGALHLTSPRAWAYGLLGIDGYLRAFQGDSAVEAVRATLCSRLLERFHHTSTEAWPWFEDRLTYCNARLPQGLMVSAARMGNAELASVAERSLTWLVSQQLAADGTFSPIGSNGFFSRETPRATWDQQPVEACAMVSACLEAHRLTGEARWLEHARCAFQWYLGQNAREAQVYDARTGGCRDGLHVDRLNENQGAESTLSFLTALTEMRAADRLAATLLPEAPATVFRSKVARATQQERVS